MPVLLMSGDVGLDSSAISRALVFLPPHMASLTAERKWMILKCSEDAPAYLVLVGDCPHVA